MTNLLVGHGEDSRPIHLDATQLETHVHGIGGTRTGKSKLIEWISRELVRQGEGFCLIDPHGQLYDELVMWLAFLRPKRELILFNASSTDRVVGFNPFTRGPGDLGARVDRLVRATAKAWGQSDPDASPRLERWLRVLYTTVLETGNTIDVTKYLFEWSERNVAAVLSAQVTDDLVRSELATLHSYSRAQDFDGQIESSKNRLFRFLSSRQIRRVMGLAENNIDIERVIESGAGLIVNLQPSDMLSEEQGRLIGTLLLNEVWQVAMRRRPDRAGGRPRAFYVILDEFQKFLTPDVPEMLDQASKYGIHLMLFHQRLDQLRARDPEAYSAVMTNARTKFVFGGLSREDAEVMVDQIYPGQVDMKKVKHVIEQTKFWPVYDREVVRSRVSSVGSGGGVSMQSSKGWNPHLEEWIPSAGAGEVDTYHSGVAEGESDIPFLRPEPFTEESSRQFYSLEEVLREMADRLMEQFQRHFVIRQPGHSTDAAVVPVVAKWYATPETTRRYVDRVLSAFLSGVEVDKRLDQARQLLLRDAAPSIRESSSRRQRRRAASVNSLVGVSIESAAAGEEAVARANAGSGNVEALLDRYRRIHLTRSKQRAAEFAAAEDHLQSEHFVESILISRKVLEGLLWDVAESVSAKTGIPLRVDPGPKAVRDYLTQRALLTEKERRLIEQVFGIQSGPLHGTAPPATREEAIFALDLARSSCHLVFQRYERWLGQSHKA